MRINDTRHRIPYDIFIIGPLVHDQRIELQDQVFFVFTSPRTWNEAVDQCAEYQSHLIVLKTTSVLSEVRELFDGKLMTQI